MARRRSRGEGTIYWSDPKRLWIAKITLPDGKRRMKYSKSQKVVRDWLLASQNELRQGMLPSDDKITVSEFIARFMDSVAKHTLRPKTLEVNSAVIRLHINPVIGKIKLASLRPDHLQSLYSQKLDYGLSRRSVQLIHLIIHKILDQAMKWGMVSRNVADFVQAPKPIKRPPTIFDSKQVNIFLSAVKDHRFFLIYEIALYCGLREREILGLCREDIDIEKGVINVNHSVQALKGKGLVFSETKLPALEEV
jgi:integrase